MRIGNILLSTTNKMQRYTIFFITVNVLHVSGGLSSSRAQELYTQRLRKDAVCTVLELLMMGGETTRNM
jgi:NH3-dependent NAD+ synthetase